MVTRLIPYTCGFHRLLRSFEADALIEVVGVPQHNFYWIFCWKRTSDSDNDSKNSTYLDCFAFHFSIHRFPTYFLGMYGNLQVTYDTDTGFITAWNQTFVKDDFLCVYLRSRTMPSRMVSTLSNLVAKSSQSNNPGQTALQLKWVSGSPSVEVPGVQILLRNYTDQA